ncbi:MAG: phage tail assembly chaperone [Pseudomonadota bacterium]
MTGRIGWDDLMRLGLGALRLAPEVFWSMTPVELERALEGAGLGRFGRSGPSRAGLLALMERFPDREGPSGPTGDDEQAG